MNDPSNFIERIAAEIVNSSELDGKNWLELSVAFEADEDQGEITGNYGYIYNLSGKAESIAFGSANLYEHVVGLREAVRVSGDVGFLRMLFQLNKANRKVNIEYEFNDEDRWEARDGDYDELVRRLRPFLK